MEKLNKADYQETFYIVPRWIRKLPGMTLTKLDFIETMFQFFNKGLPVFMENRTLKERTGIKSDDTISKCFAYFEKHEVLRRVHNEAGHRVGIEFISPKVSYSPQTPHQAKEAPPQGSRSSERGGLATPRGGVSLERDHNIKKLNKETNVKKKREGGSKANLKPAPTLNCPNGQMERAAPSPSSDVNEVINYYIEKVVKNKSLYKVTEKRKRVVNKALKDYTVEECKQAIDGNLSNPWNQGYDKTRNGWTSHKTHAPHNSLELILRDSEKIEQFISYLEVDYSIQTQPLAQVQNMKHYEPGLY